MQLFLTNIKYGHTLELILVEWITVEKTRLNIIHSYKSNITEWIRTLRNNFI